MAGGGAEYPARRHARLRSTTSSARPGLAHRPLHAGSVVAHARRVGRARGAQAASTPSCRRSTTRASSTPPPAARSTTSWRCSASTACTAGRPPARSSLLARRAAVAPSPSPPVRASPPDGNVEYATTETVTLAEAQTTIRVVARDLEANAPARRRADRAAGAHRRHRGCDQPGPDPDHGAGRDRPRAAHAGQELPARQRARHARRAEQAIARQRHDRRRDEVAAPPGRVEITPHAEALPPELQQRLDTPSKMPARPACSSPLRARSGAGAGQPRLRLTTAPGLLEQDLRAVQRRCARRSRTTSPACRRRARQHQPHRRHGAQYRRHRRRAHSQRHRR